MTSDLSSGAKPKIAIRGGGIIGLSIAFELMTRGVTPTVLDRGDLKSKASWAAAGMLSARFEALIEPLFSEDLHALSARSIRLWPRFAARLQKQSDISLSFSEGPTLALLSEGSLSQLRADRRLEVVDVEDSAERLSALVPSLKSDDKRFVVFPDDGQVDNRAVLKALQQVCRPLFTDEESKVEDAEIIIECLGWRANDVRPVKGQMVSLKPRERHPLIPVRWGASYIVPKPDRTIIGATVEPDETGLETDDEQIAAMLNAAINVCPALADQMEILERWSGLRPMARDQRPMIGWTEVGRVFQATGHYRNGILLAPATAERVADAVLAPI